MRHQIRVKNTELHAEIARLKAEIEDVQAKCMKASNAAGNERLENNRLNAEIEEGKRREGTLVRLIDSANETANNRQDEIERKDMHLRNIVVFTSVDLMREAARAALRSEIEG